MLTSGAKETTFYETLDVPASASADDIRRAFRSLAFLYHPDLAGAGGNDPSLFLRIREAYEVLIDVEKRRAYDETLRELERRREAERQAVRPVNVERPRPRDFYSPGALERRLAKPVEAVLVDATEVVRGPLDVFGAVEIALEESLRPANVTIVLPPECGAAQDVLQVCGAMTAEENEKAKALLDRIVAMLTKLGQRGYAVHEESEAYRTNPIDPDSDTDPDPERKP